MKVLAIGENAQNFAREIFPDAQVHTSTVKPGKDRKEYDSLLAYMCLHQVPYREAVETVKSWVNCLKKGGELTILVPSLEWAAVQILSKEKSPVLMVHLFGMQDKAEHYHSSAFTMLDLRSLCSLSGVAVTHASTGVYNIGEHEAELHTVRGLKK